MTAAKTQDQKPLIGAHVKQDDPLAMATATDADLVQIFMGDPQSWKKPPPREDAEAIKSSGVPVYVHSPYLVNLASPNPKIVARLRDVHRRMQRFSSLPRSPANFKVAKILAAPQLYTPRT